MHEGNWKKTTANVQRNCLWRLNDTKLLSLQLFCLILGSNKKFQKCFYTNSLSALHSWLQSIYGWRGLTFSITAKLKKAEKGCHILVER